MARKLDDNERKLVLLRTSADVLAHCVKQIDCLASDWPSYASDAKDLRGVASRLIAHAKEFGYVEKTRI